MFPRSVVNCSRGFFIILHYTRFNLVTSQTENVDGATLGFGKGHSET